MRTAVLLAIVGVGVNEVELFVNRMACVVAKHMRESQARL